MRREEIPAALRAFAARCELSARRGLGALAVRRRARSVLRTLTGPEAREHLRLGWAAVRHRPDAVLVAVVVAGVLLMILHWS